MGLFKDSMSVYRKQAEQTKVLFFGRCNGSTSLLSLSGFLRANARVDNFDTAFDRQKSGKTFN